MAKFSVLVAVYNAAATLPRCLDSLRAQTLTDFEAICIDDASTDDSWAILSRSLSATTNISISRLISGTSLTASITYSIDSVGISVIP